MLAIISLAIVANGFGIGAKQFGIPLHRNIIKCSPLDGYGLKLYLWPLYLLMFYYF